MVQTKMIMIFVDGLGIGQNSPFNPFLKANLPCWNHLVETYGYFPADACLGIPGLPQSATGQTSIYTGENAPAVLGRHFSTRPTETLAGMIHRKNIFTALMEMGHSVTFANVYTKEYLDHMQENPRGLFKPSATTLMNLSAKLPFRLLEDYRKGLGVYHDITGEGLRERGYDVSPIQPEEAAENLFRISRDYDFTLFEFFISDLAGHSMDMEQAIRVLERLDAFLGKLLAMVDLEKEVLVIASDHGNIEDLSVSTHTLNPIPVFFITRKQRNMKITKITDIYPAIVQYFEQCRPLQEQ
jgi:hypothetical protein